MGQGSKSYKTGLWELWDGIREIIKQIERNFQKGLTELLYRQV